MESACWEIRTAPLSIREFATSLSESTLYQAPVKSTFIVTDGQTERAPRKKEVYPEITSA